VVVKSEEPELAVTSPLQQLQPAISTAKALAPIYQIKKISDSMKLNNNSNPNIVDRNFNKYYNCVELDLRDMARNQDSV
jgi:hypothetical protein